MDSLFDFGDIDAQTYTQECECGAKIEVSSQKDNNPEYYAEINVRCQKCGASNKFEIPVN